jgi:hypothetical protein
MTRPVTTCSKDRLALISDREGISENDMSLIVVYTGVYTHFPEFILPG